MSILQSIRILILVLSWLSVSYVLIIQGIVQSPTPSASLGVWLAMQNFRTPPTHTESESEIEHDPWVI